MPTPPPALSTEEVSAKPGTSTRAIYGYRGQPPKTLQFKQVFGKDDPADMYTKHLDEKTSRHHIEILACRFEGGRAEEAPQVHVLSHSQDDCDNGTDFSECEWVNAVLKTIICAWDRQRVHSISENWGGHVGDRDDLRRGTVQSEYGINRPHASSPGSRINIREVGAQSRQT